MPSCWFLLKYPQPSLSSILCLEASEPRCQKVTHFIYRRTRGKLFNIYCFYYLPISHNKMRRWRPYKVMGIERINISFFMGLLLLPFLGTESISRERRIRDWRELPARSVHEERPLSPTYLKLYELNCWKKMNSYENIWMWKNNQNLCDLVNI